MKSTTQRICPNCGATNTGRSLYCAECGADLNQPPDPTATRPFEPATTAGSSSDTSQPTEAYKPLWDQTWSGATEHEEAATSPPAPQAAQSLPAGAAALVPVARETNPRSRWLGLIALLIILVIAISLGVLSFI